MENMILQPIVENCVNHGIREMSGEGRIWLKVYHGEEDTLVISIRDNGIGMDHVKLLRENGAAESADCREAIFREEFFSPYTQGWGIHEREGLGIKSLE